MSIFGKIKDAIFGTKDEQRSPTQAPRTANPAPRPSVATRQQPAAVTPRQPEPVHAINVENHLDSMPGADRLNWRTSIVDLMKLIGVDSDYESREALAHEMGRQDYKGNAEDNVWLHQRVMQELANNGGEVPASLR